MVFDAWETDPVTGEFMLDEDGERIRVAKLLPPEEGRKYLITASVRDPYRADARDDLIDMLEGLCNPDGEIWNPRRSHPSSRICET